MKFAPAEGETAFRSIRLISATTKLVLSLISLAIAWGILFVRVEPRKILRGRRAVEWSPRTPAFSGASAAMRLADFERDLKTPKRDDVFPLDAKDAVREVLRERSSLSPEQALEVAETVYREAVRHGYDPFLVLALMQVESRFNPEAISQRGAAGLMQIMPRTRRWMLGNDSEGLALSGNVRAGVGYLARLQHSFHRIDRALQAYNCGPRRLSEVMHEGAPLPPETEFFAQRVLKRYHRFRGEYAHVLF